MDLVYYDARQELCREHIIKNDKNKIKLIKKITIKNGIR